MADDVLNRIIDGDRRVMVLCNCFSDGTGETDAVKVDFSALGGSPTDVKIMKIQYNVYGYDVRLEWDATADIEIAYLQGHGELDFTYINGLTNNAGAGKTGDIVLTTAGARADAGDGYTLIFELEKVFA